MDLDSNSPAPTKYPVLPCFEIGQHDMNAATGYSIDNMFADFGPETQKFTPLLLRKTNTFAYEYTKSEDAKWVKRQQLTPTRQVFLP